MIYSNVDAYVKVIKVEVELLHFYEFFGSSFGEKFILVFRVF